MTRFSRSSATADQRWWRRLRPYFAPYSGRLALQLLTAVVLGILTAAVPWPTKFAIDNVLGDQPFTGWLARFEPWRTGHSSTSVLIALAGMSLVLILLQVGLRSVQAVGRRTIAAEASRDLAVDLFDITQQRILIGSADTMTGDTIRRITFDARASLSLLMLLVLGLWGAIVGLATVVTVTAVINWRLVVFAILGAAPLLLVSFRLTRTLRQRSMEATTADGQITGALERDLSTITEVQLLAAEEYADRQFDEVTEHRFTTQMNLQRTTIFHQLSISGYSNVATAIVVITGGWAVLDGTQTVGDIVLVLSYIGAILGPVGALAALGQTAAIARASAVRVLEIIDRTPRLPEPTAPREFPPAPGGSRLEARHVTFGYVSDQPVLQDLSTSIEPGEIVALVGPSGAGKSTLVALVSRFFDPGDGEILIDGLDVRQASLDDVRSRVSVVHQSPVLLPLTIAENIAYGRASAEGEDIVDAAKRAGAHEFITAFAQGYETIIGPRGTTLSGGQKQRIALARAVLKGSPILVLDEPTSALDTTTEFEVMTGIDALRSTRTIIIIAHRLSTVRHADRILFLDHGRIVEDGCHEDLMASGGRYASYVDQTMTPRLLPTGRTTQ